jgi:hypothetical protein
MIRIRKTDPESLLPQPQNRRMSPAAALQLMHDVQIGDILLETTENRKLRLRRVARPNGKQAELLNTLSLSLPERLCADRDITDEASLAIAQSNPSQMHCRLFAQIIAGTPARPIQSSDCATWVGAAIRLRYAETMDTDKHR